MLLYWGMFTVGFTIGTVFSFITFAAKNPEEESKDKGLTLNGKVELENPGVIWQSQKLNA